MRLWLRVARMAGALLLCLPGHYAWHLLGLRSPWPRIFLGWVGRIAGTRVTVSGQPLRAHVLLAANHLSWLDILIVAGATGAIFVSRDDVADWPVVGWLASLNDTIFVARAARGAVHGQAGALRSALAEGRAVALFPEGTTEGGVDVLPFRASLFAALLPPLPGVKVQPVAIDYGPDAHAIAWVGNEPAGSNAVRILSRRDPVPVTLHFLEPIDPASVPDRKALARAAEGEVVERLRASAPAADPL